MKKVYSKPVIIYDDFRLSTNIAAGCEKITTTQAQGTCGIVVDGIPGMVFSTGISGCTVTGADGEYSECYDVPFDYNSLFSS